MILGVWSLFFLGIFDGLSFVLTIIKELIFCLLCVFLRLTVSQNSGVSWPDSHVCQETREQNGEL